MYTLSFNVNLSIKGLQIVSNDSPIKVYSSLCYHRKLKSARIEKYIVCFVVSLSYFIPKWGFCLDSISYNSAVDTMLEYIECHQNSVCHHLKVYHGPKPIRLPHTFSVWLKKGSLTLLAITPRCADHQNILSTGRLIFQAPLTPRLLPRSKLKSVTKTCGRLWQRYSIVRWTQA